MEVRRRFGKRERAGEGEGADGRERGGRSSARDPGLTSSSETILSSEQSTNYR